MHLVGIVVIAGALWFFAIFSVDTIGRWFDPASKLGVFETRIEGVSREFMRRSPALRESFERFKACTDEYCVGDALAERDRIIVMEWPAVFDRLAVAEDWGVLRDSAVVHTIFVEAVRKKGADTLRNACVPEITYWDHRNVPWSHEALFYEFRGFRCP